MRNPKSPRVHSGPLCKNVHTLTVEITRNARAICKAHMRVTRVSVFCVWVTVWLNYHSSVHCSFRLLNHALLSTALLVKQYTATINAGITLKWKQRRNNGCVSVTFLPTTPSYHLHPCAHVYLWLPTCGYSVVSLCQSGGSAPRSSVYCMCVE